MPDGRPLPSRARPLSPARRPGAAPRPTRRRTSGRPRANAPNPPRDAESARSLANAAQAVANFRASLFTGNAVEFPPRNETLAFRTMLETKYRQSLQRPPGPSYADVEGDVVWAQEYLCYPSTVVRTTRPPRAS